MTIRQLVEERQIEIGKSGELQPERAAQLLCELSALLGNISDEILIRDIAFNKILLSFLESEEKANRAKIKAEVSPEYQRKQEARNIKELANELIRSLKFFLREKDREYREAKF